MTHKTVEERLTDIETQLSLLRARKFDIEKNIDNIERIVSVLREQLAAKA